MESIKEPETAILIVDDNTQYTMVLKRILQGVFGYRNVTSVEDPKDAFTLVQAEPDRFKMLFVDYNFPSGDTGGQFLEKLKDTDLLKDKIAFLITSEPTVDNVKQACKAGALGVVAKPFDREEIRKQLSLAERKVISDNTESF